MIWTPRRSITCNSVPHCGRATATTIRAMATNQSQPRHRRPRQFTDMLSLSTSRGSPSLAMAACRRRETQTASAAINGSRARRYSSCGAANVIVAFPKTIVGRSPKQLHLDRLYGIFLNTVCPSTRSSTSSTSAGTSSQPASSSKRL